MANAYLTEADLRSSMPDSIRPATTEYNTLMRQLCERVSRFIDRYCKRRFYPMVENRYYDGSGTFEQWTDDLFATVLAPPTIAMSTDNGATWATVLAATDYILTRAGDYNTPWTYNKIVMNEGTGNYSSFYAGQRSIQIDGIWCTHDDRATAWEDSLDTVQNAVSIGIGVTLLEVTDADGVGADGAIPRFTVGQLLRMQSEYVEVADVNYTTNVVTIVRGRNGTNDVAHPINTQIDVWRPPMPVRQAGIIQASRQIERGFQGFGDARATVEIGQLFYIKAMDPEAAALLAPYRPTGVG